MEIEQQHQQRHKERMARKKDIIDQRVANATVERGIVLLLKGTGKGKSSSAFGMVARALGHGQRVGIVQFIKGKWQTGEQLFYQSLENVDYFVMGAGFTWETQDKNTDMVAAQAAWQQAQKLLSSNDYDMVLLDEFTYMFKYQYLELESCLAAIQARPEKQNVIITGRTAPQELEDIADTVSEVRNIKHAFKSGIKTQKGIEW